MINDRNSILLQLRPEIEANPNLNPKDSAGHFQNATLRPILKLQNGLLMQIFQNQMQKSKASFLQLTPAKQLEFISNSIRSDLRYRNLLIGTIIGHFTDEEWNVFAENERELTRRMADMLVERFCDQIGVLMAE